MSATCRAVGPLAAQDVKLPLKDGSVKFAVIGDTGTGSSDQYSVGKDEGLTFMLVEVIGDELHFATVTSLGKTIDAGVVKKGTDNRVVGTAPAPKPAATAPKPAAAAPKPAVEPAVKPGVAPATKNAR